MYQCHKLFENYYLLEENILLEVRSTYRDRTLGAIVAVPCFTSCPLHCLRPDIQCRCSTALLFHWGVCVRPRRYICAPSLLRVPGRGSDWRAPSFASASTLALVRKKSSPKPLACPLANTRHLPICSVSSTSSQFVLFQAELALCSWTVRADGFAADVCQGLAHSGLLCLC